MGRARRKDKDSVSGTQLPSQTSSNSSSWCATASSGGSGNSSGAGGASANSSGTGNGASKLYVEPSVLECTLPEPKIRELVNLPGGLDYNEWLASHTIAFFDHINLIYGTISEYCTMSGCPEMTGPKLRCYQWQDEKGKKSKVAAPQYIDYVMTFTQKIVNDETIFPTKFEKEFPSNFETLVKRIHRLLFHVIAHLYHGHFRELVLLNLHGHLNCLFIHFMVFNEEFSVIDEKETDVLQDLVQALRLNCDPETKSSSSENLATSETGDGAGGTATRHGACNHVTTDNESTGGGGTSSPTPRVGKECSKCLKDASMTSSPKDNAELRNNSTMESDAEASLIALTRSLSITALHTSRVGAAVTSSLTTTTSTSSSKSKLTGSSKNFSTCAMDSAMVHNYPNASTATSVVTSSQQVQQSSQASAVTSTRMLGSSSPIKFQ